MQIRHKVAGLKLLSGSGAYPLETTEVIGPALERRVHEPTGDGGQYVGKGEKG